ncbi:MAG: hypothetical protein NTY01_11840 [Verrucomicrobia bacterium]|nr:hypothetical protein [Verrucomicrobiota bacterium]
MKKGDKKTMSLKQILANRNNSLKSTGPKTEGGKAISKLNATKNGILSDEVVVQGFCIKESTSEFRAFREQFWEHYAPVGPQEGMLVNEIVTCYWRKRRVLRAESGEIALSVDNGSWHRSHPGLYPMITWFLPAVDTLSQMEESATGVEYIMMVLEQVREDLHKDGELTEEAIQRALKSFGDKSNVITNELIRLRSLVLNNYYGSNPAVVKRCHRGAVKNCIEWKLQHYDKLLQICREHEEKQEEARQAASVLPSGEKLDKILRYETTLDRKLYHAMSQLERLQRMRKGENVPPPLTMEVSQKC